MQHAGPPAPAPATDWMAQALGPLGALVLSILGIVVFWRVVLPHFEGRIAAARDAGVDQAVAYEKKLADQAANFEGKLEDYRQRLHDVHSAKDDIEVKLAKAAKEVGYYRGLLGRDKDSGAGDDMPS